MISIETETAVKWPIPNRQNIDLVGNEQMLADKFRHEHDAEVRTAATGRYNCHGLTFASRRTCIEDVAAVQKILVDDGYVPVSPDSVMPGDVVIYYHDGVIDHSGLVVEVPQGAIRFPRIVSKWGPNGAEFLHWVHRSEYGQDYKFFRISQRRETAIISQIILGR
jgi:hypothetical protein